jgi:hypothetical protein
MFSWQVTLYNGSRAEDLIDASSQEEGELIAALAELGKRTISIPIDPPIIADILPSMEAFGHSVNNAIAQVIELCPHAHQGTVRAALHAYMTRG